jgi:ABC-type nitrate/sulfonate/bicarbonate transport system permease component
MRLNTVAMAAALGIFWGACVLLLGVANIIWPSYGQAVLQICASIYPGYHPGTGLGSVIIGTIYALIDGFVGGAIFGWLYNLLAGE